MLLMLMLILLLLLMMLLVKMLFAGDDGVADVAVYGSVGPTL